MAAWDMQLIAAIVKTKRLQDVVNRGVLPSTLGSAEAQLLFEFLIDYAARPEHPAEVASLAMLEEHFPNVADDLPSPTQSLDAIVERVLDEKLSRDLDAVLDEVSALRNKDPRKAAHVLAEASTRLYETRRAEDADITSTLLDNVRRDYQLNKHGGGVGLWPWPWKEMTDVLGRIEPGTLTVLWGQPKRGKTWLALKMVVDAFLTYGKRVLVYSPEMRKEQLERRIACIAGAVSYKKFREATLTDDEENRFFEVLGWIQDSARDQKAHERIIVLNRSGSSGAKHMCAQLESKIKIYKPDLVFVDSAYRDAESADWKHITAISRGVKDIGNRTGVPVIAVTQENEKRSNELRASGMKRRGTEAVSHSQGWTEDMDIGIRVANDDDGYIRLQWAGSREAKLTHRGIRCLYDPGAAFDFVDFKYDDPEPEPSPQQQQQQVRAKGPGLPIGRVLRHSKASYGPS